MPVCCVPCCRGNSRNGAKLYRFPINPERRVAWMSRIRRPGWEPTRASFICSKHFETSCYEENRKDGWRRLKLNAVPTVFPPRASPTDCKPATVSLKKGAEIDSSNMPVKTEPKHGAATKSKFISEICFHDRSRHTALNETCIIGLPRIADGSLLNFTEGAVHEEICSGASARCNAMTAQSDTSATTPSTSPSQSGIQPPSKSVSSRTGNPCCFELKGRVSDITKRYKNLYQHHEEAKKEIWILRNKLKRAEQQLQALHYLQSLPDDQKKALSKLTSRGVAWTVQTEVASPS